ncbi:hypothetical protein QWY75_12385 [Pontixanthobacter aestiaquae]|uniref:SGNH/GDSL hydrolase family protein n=1 Tax=Pontixanthobacter aestiaquae TaxID=1509367 RepID=A0A844Z7Y4_9SPHN|nr:hypothetical protein [Pontixanthobacter aestiaquae]MDN3647002.1 hypothetical protein [Pontixanthobacter aestiaquae]MXO82019.1 hypothetical protein [Pontixanthobacter aestiaquae]
MSLVGKLTGAYRSIAFVVFNTLVFLVLINLALWAAFAVHDHEPSMIDESSPPSPEGYFRENGTAIDNGKRMPTNLTIFDYKAFENIMSEREIGAMLDEYYDHFHDGLKYQAFTQYAPRVFAGEYLNVTREANGLTVRRTINPPADAAAKRTIRIFTFGGSTTFGQGVADQHTWPTRLSEILNARAKADGLDVHVEVTNYGRVGFYPTQELHLLMEVLRSGERPDMAIFLDGLNLGEDNDTSGLTKHFSKAVNETQRPTGARWDWIPMIRAANAVNARLNPNARTKTHSPSKDERLAHTLERFTQFRTNVQAVSDLYGVKPVFFLQPDAHYNYPVELYGRGELLINPPRRAFKERFYAQIRKDGGFIDLTELFSDWGNRKAVVDSAHFSPNFSQFVAENIANNIDLTDIGDVTREESIPTGIPKL